MKKISIAALVVVLAMGPVTNPAVAQSGAADLGIKLAEKVVSSMIGAGAAKVFHEFFNSGPDPLTVQDVEGAISRGLEHAAATNAVAEKNAMLTAIRVYNHALHDAINVGRIRTIIDQSGLVFAQVKTHINKAEFMRVMPAYITARNVRLTFLAEEYRYIGVPIIGDSLETQATGAQLEAAQKAARTIIAQEALEGLHFLGKFMSEDFFDPNRRRNPCLIKSPNTVIYFPSGIAGSNRSEKGNDISKQYCLGNGRIIKQGLDTGKIEKFYKGQSTRRMVDPFVINMNGVGTMLSTDIMKVHTKNKWQFVSKTKVGPAKYRLHTASSLAVAQIVRNFYNTQAYPSELGNLRVQMLSWLDVIQAYDETYLLEGMKEAYLAGYTDFNALMKRYPKEASKFHTWIKQTIARLPNLGDHDIETLSTQH